MNTSLSDLPAEFQTHQAEQEMTESMKYTTCHLLSTDDGEFPLGQYFNFRVVPWMEPVQVLVINKLAFILLMDLPVHSVFEGKNDSFFTRISTTKIHEGRPHTHASCVYENFPLSVSISRTVLMLWRSGEFVDSLRTSHSTHVKKIWSNSYCLCLPACGMRENRQLNTF